MGSPPFRFAGSVLTGVPLANVLGEALAAPCCPQPAPEQADKGPRRIRLAELNHHLHCSVIGTCLGTAELRKLVPRFTDLDRQRASDLDIHHAAVQLATEGGAGAKALHKALDERYDVALKRFQRLKDADEVRACWDESLKTGDVPGAYWALMTHPQVTAELRQHAFGEVHMLSHLVGAANRADIRRLQALEQQNAELADKLERQQQRLLDAVTERQALAQQLSDQATSAAAAAPDGRVAELGAQLAALKLELATKEQALAHHTQRREVAELQMQQAGDTAQAVQQQLDKTLGLVETLQAELSAVENQLAERFAPQVVESTAPAHLLRQRRVVYVGGRPGSNHTIQAIVEAAGGEIILHDGGIEDRKGLLAAALPRADMVVFPVDCIDHDSMSMLKRICDKHQIPFHPVRSASAASFSALLARLAAAAAPVHHAPPVSRFCLRHG